MAKQQIHSGSLILMAIILFLYVCTSSAYPALNEQDATSSDDVDDQQWVMEKRPFCNAFAGCGRKRASSAKESHDALAIEKVLNSYPRLVNAENKLWDRLYAKLQQRYRSNYDSINN